MHNRMFPTNYKDCCRGKSVEVSLVPDLVQNAEVSVQVTTIKYAIIMSVKKS